MDDILRTEPLTRATGLGSWKERCDCATTSSNDVRAEACDDAVVCSLGVGLAEGARDVLGVDLAAFRGIGGTASGVCSKRSTSSFSELCRPRLAVTLGLILADTGEDLSDVGEESPVAGCALLILVGGRPAA